MCNGGLFWFEDLSVADPYYILPTVMCSTTFLQIKLGADGMNAGAMGPVAKQVIYLIPPVMFLFMKDFPAVSATNVLGSASIWTCRISNICFDFFQLRLPEAKNNKYSIFDTSKSMSYQGHK